MNNFSAPLDHRGTRHRAPTWSSLLALFLLCSYVAPDNAVFADEYDSGTLRQQLKKMQQEQQQLKAQIEVLEEQTRQQRPPAQAPTPSSASVTSGTRFNPQISAILDGNFYQDTVDGGGSDLLRNAYCPGCSSDGDAGHGEAGHSHGGAEQGFNIREAELYLSANVDPYFEATAIFSIAEEGIETEEAFFATRALPAGLKLKAGKFFSGIGYINEQHPHQWDFVDQNLAYLNVFDFNLQDIGIQLTWQPALPVYTLFGIEIAQGDQERFGASVSDSDEREALGLNGTPTRPSLFTGFVKVAPDLGYDDALQLGAWLAHNGNHQAISQLDDGTEVGLEGDATAIGLDLVYRHDAPRSYGAGDVVLQAEYLYQQKHTKITGTDTDGLAVETGAPVDFANDGFYVQGRYGFLPRWQLALRYDALGMTNRVSGVLDEAFGSSHRWSLVLSWTPTEFSRFRLQGSRADLLEDGDGNREVFNYIYLQYLISLGSHGAHRF